MTHEKEYYPSIDGLRALAVMSVFVYHLKAGWLPGGFVGVDVFFVISGFVVAHSAGSLSQRSWAEFFIAFYARRMVRIFPALLVCLSVTALVATLFIPDTWLSQSNGRSGLFAYFGLSNFVLASAAGDYFSPLSEYNPFTHTWSLAVEEQFYLLFPLFMYAFLRAKDGFKTGLMWMMGVLVVLSLICCIWWSHVYPAQAFYLLPARLWELGLGVLISLAWPSLKPGLERWADGAMFGVVQGLALAGMLTSLALAKEALFPYPWAMVPVVATAVLLATMVAKPRGLAAKLLATRGFVWLGKRSYSLYLWHWPVFVLMRWTVGLDDPLELLLAGMLAMLLAWASYEWVELPARQSPSLKQMNRPRLVAASMLTVFMAAVLCGGIFKAKSDLSLSVVTRHKDVWFPYAEPLVASTQSGCVLRMTVTPIGSGEVRTITPHDCRGHVRSSRLWVAGDSHASAYLTMLSRFAQENKTEVSIVSKGGCALYNLKATNGLTEGAECRAFSRAAIAHLDKQLRPGDALFLPSLRVPRFSNQWGLVPPEPGWGIEPISTIRAQAIDEAVQDLQPLKDKGVTVIFELPKPVFLSAPYRCADWFNKTNPVCRQGFAMDKGQLETHRVPAIVAIQAVVKGIGGGHVWDPFPVLCPGARCNTYLENSPLFFDGDHLSGFGNEYLYGFFAMYLSRIW